MSPAARYAFYLRRSREAFICARAWRKLGHRNMAAKWLTYAGDCRRLAIQHRGNNDGTPIVLMVSHPQPGGRGDVQELRPRRPAPSDGLSLLPLPVKGAI